MNRETLWSPSDDAWERCRLGAFARRHRPEAFGDYPALWRWSVDEPAAFWSAVWDELGLVASTPPSAALGSADLPGAAWFPGARLNYAEHLLRGGGLDGGAVAIVGESQSRAPRSRTLDELRDEVRRAAAGLRRLGVGPGDRVAAYLPNIDETVVAFLASAAIGAIWSSCAPEFGTRSVLDRWTQIEPTVLLTVDGYRYGAKDLPAAEAVAAIRAGLSSVRATVVLPYLAGAEPIPDAATWSELVAPTDEPLAFEPVAFDHPLYILYSSGTTGLPKPIVHGHGGILLEHGKAIALHVDLGPGDRFFWFSTTGWMMWNYVVSALSVGSSIVAFDGNPGHPDLDVLWSLVGRTGATWAGMSAPFIMACRDAELHPAADHDLSALRGIGSTGAPLPAAGFRWLAEELPGRPIDSISGGTDVCSAFVGGAPVLPVRPGVISCRQLGWKIEAFDESASPVVDVEGELVITAPAPSMPVGFWGDADGSRYRDTYFSTYPGVWRHGDWITIGEDGSCVISGRSDATLNRGGVRLGTADFYAVVESDPAVADSLVVHLEDDGGGLGELILFAAPAEGGAIDDEVRARLLAALRSELSPRHAPDEIVEMPEIPRTLSGKKLEVPVKRILRGVDRDRAASVGALINPASLDPYVEFARGRSG
ncbi:MAG: acetoacetate--CoA ligase [Actinomycetota bacterium]